MSRKIYNISNHWRCTLLRNKDRVKLIVNLQNLKLKPETNDENDVQKQINARSFKLRTIDASRAIDVSNTLDASGAFDASPAPTESAPTKYPKLPLSDIETLNNSNIIDKCADTTALRLGEHLGKKAFENINSAFKSLEAEAIKPKLSECSPCKENLCSKQDVTTKVGNDNEKLSEGCSENLQACKRTLMSSLKDQSNNFIMNKKPFPEHHRISFLSDLFPKIKETNETDYQTFAKCENNNKILELHTKKYHSSKKMLSKTLKNAAEKYVIKNNKPSTVGLVLDEHLERWRKLKRHKKEMEERSMTKCHLPNSTEFYHLPRKQSKQEYLKEVARRARQQQEEVVNKLKVASSSNRITRKDLESQCSSKNQMKKDNIKQMESLTKLEEKQQKQVDVEISLVTKDSNIKVAVAPFNETKEKSLENKGLVEGLQKEKGMQMETETNLVTNESNTEEAAKPSNEVRLVYKKLVATKQRTMERNGN